MATIYTDDSALNNFVSAIYNPEMLALGDSKIDSWFTESTADPSETWEGTDTFHTGDIWWTTDTKQSFRWMGTAWSDAIQDQDTIDAMALAAEALDTADGKRRVFVLSPTDADAYDIGDLWIYNYSVLVCNTSKIATETYFFSHWETAADITTTPVPTER